MPIKSVMNQICHKRNVGYHYLKLNQAFAIIIVTIYCKYLLKELNIINISYEL